MSIVKGTLGYTRFFLDNPVVRDPESIVKQLNLFRFRALHPMGEDVKTHGWCPYLSEFDTDKVIAIKDIFFDDLIVFSLRIDAISMPKDLLKSMVQKSCKNYFNDHKKWPDKMVKKEIEKAETRALRARILPKTKIVEIMWDQKQGVVRVLSRAQAQLDIFAELFLQTFQLRPKRADFSLLVKDFKNQLENITHKPLFVPEPRQNVQ